MKFKAIIHILAIALVLLSADGCGHRASDNPTLLHAAHLLENEPDSIQEAKQMLDSLNTSSLDEGDRSLLALLSVKANDKLYITHTSDSLILSSVRYEEKHPERAYYPEALYYAGRVYSDLGDYPSALTFFNQAADMDDIPLPLKCRIFSQTARLYNDVHLYSDAIPPLSKAIKINETLADTANLSFNNQLLGAIYMHQGKLDSADLHVNRAYRLAANLSPKQHAFMALYKAIVKYKLGQITSGIEGNLSSKTEEIKRRIQDTILTLSYSKESSGDIDETMVSSVAYEKLQRHMANKLTIQETDPLWDELEKTVCLCSPDFVNNLRLLFGNLSDLEFRLLLLIKYGVKPGEAAEMLHKSKQTVSGYRTKLRKRLAGEGISTEYLDIIIRKL